MDNIQKSVITVLGIACLIALLIPSGNKSKLANQEPTSVEASQAKVAPPAPMPSNPEGENEEGEQDDLASLPDEYATFGQPMNDAMPLGQGNNQNVQSESQPIAGPVQSTNVATSDTPDGGQFIIPANVPDRAIQ